MKTILAVTLIAGLSWAGLAHPDATHTQSRPVDAFHDIQLRGPITAEIIRSEAVSLVVEGDDTRVENTLSETGAGRLVVMAPGGFWYKHPVHVVITCPDLDAITLIDAAHASLEGFAGPHLRITLDGAADLSARGRYSKLELMARAASTARLERLEARVVFVRLESASKASVAAIEALVGSVSEASDLIDFGDPAKASLVVDAASRVEYRSLK